MKDFTFQFNIENSPLVPVYMQIKEQIKETIVAQNSAFGTMLPSIKKIAVDAGVSSRTVDMGLKELIKDGTLFRRPKKGTFVADYRAKHKIFHRKICGILSHERSMSSKMNAITSHIYRGMQMEAIKQGVDLIFISESLDECSEHISFYSNNNDLNLTSILSIKYDDIRESLELADRFPELRFVELNYWPDGFELSPDNVFGVFNDDFAGAYQIMNSMLEQGHKKMGILSIPLRDENYHNRIKGFQAAIDNNGSGCEMRVYSNEPLTGSVSRDKKHIGYNLTKQLFAEGYTPDVLMCVSDLLAVGAVSFLNDNTDKKAMVCGYDNILPELSRDNKFSTMSIDFEKMGRKAMSVACHKGTTLPKIIKIPPNLISR